MMFNAKAAARWSMAVLVLGLGAHVARAGASATIQAFDAPDGETYYAVALQADHIEAPTPSRKLVILVDTSASQVGEHREHGLSVLRELLSALPSDRQLTVYAVDIQTVPLTAPDVTPQVALQTAIPRLRQRFPAGATDMRLALTTALQALAGSDGGAVLYLGDGMSTANLIQQADMQDLLQDLRDRQTPVSSYAVGPRTDLQLLGILAQHTGGRVLVDEGMDQRRDVVQIGEELTAVVLQPVYFPTSVEVVPKMVDLVPHEALPLRTDRETIYLGRGILPGAVTVTLSGADQVLRIPSRGQPMTGGNTFLYGSYRQAELNGGLNPLAGMEMYRQAQQGFEDEIARLEAAGEQAVIARDFKTAEQLGLTIKNFDPANVRAEVLIGAAGDLQVRTIAQTEAPDDSQAPPFPQLDPAAPAGPTPATSPTPAAPAIPDSRLLPGDLQGRESPLDQSLIEGEVDRRKVAGERLTLDVGQVIESSEQRLNSDPLGARNDLESALGAVKSAQDISPEVRAQLLRRVNSAIDIVRSRTASIDQRNIRAQQRLAEQEAQRRLVEASMLDELRLAQLVDRVRALIWEGYRGNEEGFEEAEAVARQITSMRPGSAIGVQTLTVSEAAGQLDKAFRLRTLRQDRFLATLHQVELSHVPFPDEPPVRYPPAPVWRALTERRAKWNSVDLHQNSPNEERIYRALEDETNFEFVDTPLSDAIDYISQLHNITILMDDVALTDVGIATDEPINLVLSGVRLRSAMKIMLEGLGLTWVVEDEVMKITTIEAAEEKLQTRVYPVGDLVISPAVMKSNVGGAGGGLGGGGLGGGLGGGGGGLGGGGGIGGGGGGFGGGGGGGGFYSVADPISGTLDAAPNPCLKKKPLDLR